MVIISNNKIYYPKSFNCKRLYAKYLYGVMFKDKLKVSLCQSAIAPRDGYWAKFALILLLYLEFFR